jgi:uncharacterized protein (TIGR04255 family)
VSYKKPLLIEILVEIHLEVGSFHFQQIVSVLPRLHELGFSTVEWDQAVRPKEQSQELELSPRVRCWSEDRKRLVQLSPDLLVVNQLGHYNGWAKFKETVMDVARVSMESLRLPPARFLALKTIDQLEAPADGFSVGRFFKCDGETLPRSLSFLSVACDLNWGSGLVQKDGFNRSVVLAVKPPSEGGQVDSRLLCTFQRKLEGEIGVLLDALHDDAVKTFEGLITDETRRRMES